MNRWYGLAPSKLALLLVLLAMTHCSLDERTLDPTADASTSGHDSGRGDGSRPDAPGHDAADGSARDVVTEQPHGDAHGDGPQSLPDASCQASGSCACDAASCPNGCCNGNTCVPYASQAAARCGTRGAACVQCASGQACGAAGTCDCTPSSCPNGCCDASNHCNAASAQSAAACGSSGNACGTCAPGQACSNGGCSCGNTSCTGCCANGVCVDSSNQSCGVSGGQCLACGSGQRCNAQGKCVCDAATCPSGCCDSTGQCQTSNNMTCGTGGVSCQACAAGLACNGGGQCVCTAASCASGCCSNAVTCTTSETAAACGTGGTACITCDTGQRCNGTNCVCDGASCPSGCCDSSGQCNTSGNSTCGSGGASCQDCGSGRRCNASGQCVCDATSCPSGCCNGSGQCTTSGNSTCGISGASCQNCGSGRRCNAGGQCVCDATSCPSGCCNVSGQCQTPDSVTCGTGGVACQTCAHVTVTKSGSGTVTSNVGGLNCGSTCAISIAPNTSIQLKAVGINGTNSVFAGWGGACSGRQQTCSLTVSGDMTVSASFATPANNLVFISSETVNTNLGSLGAYDAKCNALATTAGINNSGGNGFIAWMNDNSSDINVRLGGAQGFITMDLKPFAVDANALFTLRQTLNPIELDETGAKISGRETIWTGVDYYQSTAVAPGHTCQNWTYSGNQPPACSTDSTKCIWGTQGQQPYGGGAWTGDYYIACSQPGRIYCFQKTKTTPLAPPIVSGKRIYLTWWNSGGGIADAHAKCTADKPAGVGTVKAFLSTTSTPGSSFISSGTMYVRPDGSPIGMGSELISGARLSSGIWQFGPNSFSSKYLDLSRETRIGSAKPNQVGTLATTCNDWTSTSGSVLHSVGHPASLLDWWSNPSTRDCADTFGTIYCVEQ